MGRYIDDILQPGEKLLFASNLHWVVYWKGIVAWIAATVLLVLGGQAMAPALMAACLIASGVAAVLGLVWVAIGWFRRWTTETDVTTLRVVHKEGFITRKTFEISIDKVASVNVNQSIMGRILNYGDVTIENMGDDEQVIKMIASPLAFRSYITAR